MAIDNSNKRNYDLDSLRGIAAIGVLLWHYRHFLEITQFNLPYKKYLLIFYNVGWIYVDFFFCLSGFIFFYYYKDKIYFREVDFRTFIILRFSRLYPLLIVTLVVTGILNHILLVTQGRFLLYQNNNYFSFLTNLFFLQSGFLKIGFSFNAPSWSLGIEFWIYLIFFYLAFKHYKNLLLIAGLISIFSFSALNNEINCGLIIFSTEFQRGLSSFFLGGIVYYIHQYICNYGNRNLNFIGFSIFCISIIGYVLAYLKMLQEPNKIWGTGFYPDSLAFCMFMHPAMILAVSISPILNKIFSMRLLRFLGDISYSTYLWHIPIQLFIFILFFQYHIQINPSSKSFFLLYFGSIFFISYLSHRCIEIPLQNKIRSNFLNSYISPKLSS